MPTLCSEPFSVKTSCDFIINSVRDSSLNFSIQKTPYSLYLTIRKTFNKTFLSPEQSLLQSLPSFGGDQNRLKEIDTLKQKVKKEQESNEELRNNYIEAVDDTELSC